MKPYLIKFWHGHSPNYPNSQFDKKVLRVARKNKFDPNLYFDGNLDEFEELWREKFLYYPAHDSETEVISGTIYVTQFESFNAR